MIQVQNQNKSINGKITFTIFILGLCWATNYSLAFIQYLLYDPFKEALGATNAQLGLLMTIYGIGNIVGLPIGGWIADKFNYKKIFLASLVGNSLLALYFAFNMTYTSAIIVWIGLAFTSLMLNYPSHIKIVRMLVDEESQGKIFGMNEASVGIGNIIINALFLFLFSKYIEQVAGLKVVILSMSALSFICFIAAIFIVPNPNGDKDETKEEEKMTGKDFWIVLKSPATWMVGIGIFAVYSFTVTMSYFTPYFTAVFGLTVAFSGSLSLIRTYGLRLVGAPFGGWLGDKMKSVSKVLIVVYVVGIIVLLTFLSIPTTTPISIIIAITLTIAFLVFMGRGVYYAVASEINIPRKYAASTVGIGGALGFSPDIFQFTLFGSWLDKYGNTGYNYMFIYQIVILVIGIFGSLYVLKHKKSLNQTSVE